LNEMVAAARKGDRLTLSLLVREHLNQALSVGSGPNLFRLRIEAFTTVLNPFSILLPLYGLFLLLTLVPRLHPRNWLLPYAFPILAVLHAGALLGRITILQRPPLSSLYDTLVTTGFLLIPLAWLWLRPLGPLIRWRLVALGNLLLLLTALSMNDQEQGMAALAAILNTHFWLTVHVLTIIMGYAGFMAFSLSGHLYLLSRDATEAWAPLQRRILSFALFFTALGTYLGGVWADLSWGRFWGWDPKENGALILVIAAAWGLHTPLLKKNPSRRMAFFGLFCGLLLSLAWLGINLLGLGLHAYGYSPRTLWGLILFWVLEALFTAVVILRDARHHPKEIRVS